MPLMVDNFIQINSGSFEGTSGSATLPASTEAGSTVIVVVGLGGDGTTSFSAAMADSEFKKVSASNPGTRQAFIYQYLKPSSPGGESSFTINVTGGSTVVCWAAFEVTNLDATEEYVEGSGAPGAINQGTIQPSTNANTAVASRSTNSYVGPVESYSSLDMACFMACNTTPTAPTISGHTNDYFEISTASRTNAAVSRAYALSVAVKSSLSLVNYECTASVSPDSAFGAIHTAFTAVDTKHAPKVEAISGFEVGTVTGLTAVGIANGDGPPPFDVSVGSPAIVSTSPRTGNYALELSSASAAEYVGWTAPTSPAAQGNLNKGFGNGPVQAVDRWHVHFPTSLPSGDVELGWMEVGSSGNGVTIWYRSASQKIGVKVGTGTEVLSDTTVAANKWIGIDVHYDPRTTTHTVSWAVDYDSTDTSTSPVLQTAATNTGMTAGRVTGVFWGWPSSRTATVRYDDLVLCRQRKAFPLGRLNVRPLKVDPAGTPTISGTSTNFQVFTNNGSGAAWNATNARNAVDDVPPSIGSTADGIMQVNVATSDYVELPMETYTAAPDEVPRAARWYWAGWAGSGNPAFCRFDILDGTLDRIQNALDDHGFDDAALIWLGGIHRGSDAATFYLLDQTKVDGLKCRWGFSNDANPDVGIHNVLVELVTQPATEIIVTDAEDGQFRAYARQDPFSQALAGVLVATPDGDRGATFYWTLDGVESSHYVNPGSTWETPIGATDIAQVTAYRLVPDPTP